MSITATELGWNLGKYLLFSAKEDILITKNGQVIAELMNPNQSRRDIAKFLFGILPGEVSLDFYAYTYYLFDKKMLTDTE